MLRTCIIVAEKLPFYFDMFRAVCNYAINIFRRHVVTDTVNETLNRHKQIAGQDASAAATT